MSFVYLALALAVPKPECSPLTVAGVCSTVLARVPRVSTAVFRPSAEVHVRGWQRPHLLHPS